MITPRSDSSFFSRQPEVTLFVEEQRISKPQSYVTSIPPDAAVQHTLRIVTL